MKKSNSRAKGARKASRTDATKSGKQVQSRLDWRPIRGRLWRNQVQALERLDAFFGAKNPTEGALVQMPTGTGKTIIIAISARLRAQDGGVVLVVSPSAGLAEQLKADLQTIVWSRLGLGSPWSDVDVTTLLRSNSVHVTNALAARNKKPQFLIGTLQALTDIGSEDPSLYQQIAGATCAVLVDEGHREPAPVWRDSVEGLGSAVVLFSATPYRNDLRAFNVDSNHIVYRSFRWAVDERLIRDVDFDVIQAPRDAGGFALESVRHFAKMERDGKILPGAKAILRFGDESSILAAVAALEGNQRANELGFVAVHENFTSADAHRVQYIQDLRARPERLFLHQFKLCEGVDEPRCSVLYLHQAFGNERQLVQQIGRCVRRIRPRAQPEPNALVMTLPDSPAPKSWAMYLEFDATCERNGAPPIFNDTEYGRLLRALAMPAEYAGRKFRVSPPVELDEHRVEPIGEKRQALEQALARDVIVPRRCVVYSTRPGTSFGDDVKRLEEQIRDRDRIIMASTRPYPNDLPELHVVVCHKVDNSELFDRFTFIENTYTVTILYRRSERLYIFDSGRLSLPGDRPVGPDDLSKLLPERDSTRVTMAATRNTDISPHAARGREIMAASLRETPPSLTDFLSVLSRVRGHVESDGLLVGRYIGLFTGRLSDGRSVYVDIQEFSDWCASIERDLDSTDKPAHVFRRYAQPIAPPSTPTPKNILLDFTQLGTAFRNIESNEDLLIEDYCSDVDTNDTGEHLEFPWRFNVRLVPSDPSSQPVDATCFLKYETATRFTVHSDDLARYVSLGEETPISALEAVDRAQAFRIVLGDGKEAYAYGQFYSVAPSIEAMRDIVRDLLVTDVALTPLKTEKGDTSTPGTRWDADSVFGYLDATKANIPMRQYAGNGWTYVICEDLLTEIADFIAYKINPPSVAFIHAKRPSTAHLLSASALHEVLAQAIKNLDAIRIGGSGIPAGQAAKWNGVWKLKERRIPRIRKGGLTGARHVANLKELLSSATTQRHVCVVIAGGIRRQNLLQELAKNKPSVVAIQAFLLLTAFYAEVSSLGIIPTVICD